MSDNSKSKNMMNTNSNNTTNTSITQNCNNSNNNNNYVDFNQFILQHNFVSPTSTYGINSSGNNSSVGSSRDIYNFPQPQQQLQQQQQHQQRQQQQQQQQQQIQPTLNNFYGFYSGRVPYIPNNYFYGYPFENSLPSSTPIFQSQQQSFEELQQQQPQHQQQNEISTILTSNLLPTAAEFVPRFNNMKISSSASPSPLSSSSLSESLRQSKYQQNTLVTEQQQKEQNINNQIMLPKNDNITNNVTNKNNTGTINKVIPSTSYSYNSRQRYFDENRLNNDKYYHHNNQNHNNYGGGNNNNYGGSNNSFNNKNIQKAIEANRHSKRRESWRYHREPECYRNDKYDTSDSDDSQNQKKLTKQNEMQNLTSDSLLSKAQIQDTTIVVNEKLSQREKLIREIDNRKLECLVCVEQIKVYQSVWSCNNCYHILHLTCIIKWASSSKSEEGWRCPACQNITKTIPRDYYCFCGKTKNPQYNRSDLAHSCGEQCRKKDNCQHPCTLQCHPGPCPPCQANVNRKCGCGKTQKSMQCCMKDPIQCDNICGKLLNCEIHTCEKICHQDKCPSCEHKVDQKCHCGKLERQIACTRESNEKKTFSCGKPCNKMLACGNHKCKEFCHLGDCKPCKLIPDVITSCPCGKMPILKEQRKSCLDPIPVCSGICGKILKCGPPAFPHHCISKCHAGNCPPCNKQTAIKCRCGHMDQMIKCRQLSTRADDARCKKRCTKKRSCGKHKCNQECCIDIDHICPLPCNYTLSCGKHKCDQPCHRGNCPPCYRSSFDELHCECGANVIYPPVPCGTKRPACDRPCARQHTCDHPVKHNCHSASTCPPCMIFTTKWCYGHHEQRKTIPCSQESFSCGLPCNKELPCGRHKCTKPCHEGPCQIQGDVCVQSCTKLRILCGHKCNAPCHEGDCPETPCKEMVEVICQCGNRKQMRTCQEISSEYRRIATAQLASSMQEMQRGNFIEISDIMGPMKMNNNKTLECNEDCRQLERNRRLTIGLQIRNPDLTPSKILTKYSDFVRGWAKKDPPLVKMIHDTLTNLVKLAKDSKQKSRSHSFPTMNRDKRQLVHEMCGMFGVDSVAYDAEPNRNVVATAYKDRCWLPAMSIMEVLQRENGQRRIPVPNNNAWGNKK